MSAKGEVNLGALLVFQRRLQRSSDRHVFLGRKVKIFHVHRRNPESVCNLATWDLRQQMNTTSGPFPRGVDEMKEAGLAPARSILGETTEGPSLALRHGMQMAANGQACRPRRRDDRTTRRVRPGDRRSYVYERYIKDGLLDTGSNAAHCARRLQRLFVSTPETKFSLRRPTRGTIERTDDTAQKKGPRIFLL